LQDRRVAVELDELCRGNNLRATGDMAEFWKLKEACFNYISVMHKLWPTDCSAQIIYKVLEDMKWGAIAGDDKKLRANMVRQFFNEMTEENAGRAVIKSMCLTYLEGRAKWQRMIDREFPHSSAQNGGARSGGGGGSKSQSAFSKKFKGTSTMASGSGQAGSSKTANSATGGSRGNASGPSGSSGRQGGQAFSTPIPRFQGLPVCWEFNKAGCNRPAHSTNSCKAPNSTSIFAHVCNYFDSVTKTHCYGAHSRMEPGRH